MFLFVEANGFVYLVKLAEEGQDQDEHATKKKDPNL